MKPLAIPCFCLIIFACSPSKPSESIDQSPHGELDTLRSTHFFTTLFSRGNEKQARKQADLVNEAYEFLSEIMGPKENFRLWVLSRGDWETYSSFPVVGMPSYYQGTLIVGSGKSDISSIYEEMVATIPGEAPKELQSLYINEKGEFDLDLFFDKLVVHELTHSFQDPRNEPGFSVSRWLEELHANMGLYAYYKSRKPEDLPYLSTFVDFCVAYPPPTLTYSSLSDLDKHYYDMAPENYGYYQMRLTQAAMTAVDSLGNAILKPLNNFLITYDESWKEKWTEEEFKEKLESEVSPYFGELMEGWNEP